ncbi:MAG: ABC transporter substrate-binding protein, partial [Syntrophaceae bacterium]|nr:ABC transporter substrate-binding protein [Syntrophaceae bacterium]
MMKKNMFLISTVLAISLLFSFSIENKAIAAETIKIGAVLPLADITGKDASRSMQLAVKQINAAGGLLGRQVELVLVDDEGMPDKALAAIEKLVNTDKVDVIVGGVGNAVTMEIAPLLKRYQKITVWTGASSNKVDQALEGQNWFFHLHAWDYELGPYYERIWREIVQKYPAVKKKIIYVFYREDPLGSDIYNVSVPVAQANLNMLKGEAYQDAADFPALLKNVVKFNPNIFIWDGSEKDAAPILEAAKNYGFAPPVFLGKSVATWPADFGKQVGSEGVMFYSFWHESMKDRNKPCLEYIDAFGKEFKETPATYFGPLAYSNIMIVADAIKKAGSLEREVLISTLAATKYDSPLGDTIAFNRSLGVTHQAPIYPKLFQWQSGSVKIIWPWELATGKLIYPFPAQSFNPPPSLEEEEPLPPPPPAKTAAPKPKPAVKSTPKPAAAPVKSVAPVAKPKPTAPASKPAPKPTAVAPTPTPAPAPAPAPAPPPVAPAPKPAPAVPEAPAANMAGAWAVDVVTPQGPGHPYFDLKQQGNKLTGNYVGTFGESSVGGSV